MMFEHFGKSMKEEDLAVLLNTNTEVGTITDEMPRIAADQGFSIFEKKDASMRDLEGYVERGMPVVVDFIEPSEENRHFAVVVGFDEENVILSDPWNGEGFQMKSEEFQERWGSSKNRYTRWMMVLNEGGR
jgi:predicted double-glycine peptidase